MQLILKAKAENGLDTTATAAAVAFKINCMLFREILYIIYAFTCFR